MSSGSTPIISSQNGKIFIDQDRDQLVVNNSNNKRIAALGVQTDGSINLKFFDTNGLTVGQFGQNSDGSTNLKFFDVNNVGVAQFGRNSNGSTTLDVAKSGIEVSTATADQKIMSSSFNLWKIFKEGTLPYTSLAPRNASLTLGTTYIGYEFRISVNILDAGATFTNNALLNICFLYSKRQINGSGTWYDDGTNKVIYKWNAECVYNSNQIAITYRLRLIAGTYTFNPNTDTRLPFRSPLYYQIANTTQGTILAGVYASSSGDGKYYYFDTITLNADGTVNTALASSTVEFVGGNWAYFPG